MNPNNSYRWILNQPKGTIVHLPDSEKVEYLRAGLLLVKINLN